MHWRCFGHLLDYCMWKPCSAMLACYLNGGSHTLGCKILSINQLRVWHFTEVLNRVREREISFTWGKLKVNQFTPELTTPQMLRWVSNKKVGCKERTFTAILTFSNLETKAKGSHRQAQTAVLNVCLKKSLRTSFFGFLDL